MLHKSKLFILMFISILLIVGISDAKTYTVSPTGSQTDQKVINDALNQAAQDGGGVVYLTKNGANNVFLVTGSIIIKSSNIVLTGDQDIIVRVSPLSSQWFTGTNSIIYSNGFDNIEIFGFQIDGTCNELNFEFHHSRPDTAHDCERAILIAGSAGQFCSNIRIHDMQIYDCFSDGIHVRFANNAHCYSNFISNCQHEGIFWVCVVNGLMESNEIAGITSDCIRPDNCVNVIVQYNYCYSYSGDHSSQAPMGEECGIQIADAGASHGYDASNKPTHTTNVEVRWNTFANTGDKAVWLDSTGKGYDNVYVHDNKFVDVAVFTNNGESVSVNVTAANASLPNYHDISGTVKPTKETSKKIFNSIFDLFSMNFVTQVSENDTVILPEDSPQIPSEVSGTIEYCKIGDNYTTLVHIPPEGLSEVQYEVNGNTTTHTLMIGEKTFDGVVFTETSIWDENSSHDGDALKLPGKVEPDKIKVKCLTPTSELTPALKTTTTEFKTAKFHPAVILLILACILAYMFFRFSLKHML